MNIGDRIYSNSTKVTYTIVETFKAGGQAEVAFATSDMSDKLYFLKRLLHIKYTEKTKKDCLVFESKQRKLYDIIKKNALVGSSCPIIEDFFREHSFYYVVNERIVGMSCDTFELYKALTIQERLDLFRIIVYSFFPLEQAGIIHADVKPDNILLKMVNHHYVSKLIDLESAFFASDPPSKGSIVGTDPYASPELIAYNNEESDTKAEVLSPKCDIFSLGIILYELCCGKYPAKDGEYVFEMVNNNKKIEFPNKLSNELVELIRSMLELDSKKRPSVMEILYSLNSIKDISKPIDECATPSIEIVRDGTDTAKVILFCLSYGSTIRYSIDGEDEKEYDGPIDIYDDDIKLSAVAVKHNINGFDIFSSPIECEVSISSERNGRVVKPYIDLDYETGLISIDCDTVGAQIYYTVDNTLPSRKSNLYTSPIKLPEKTIIRAIAIKRGMYNSDIAYRNTSSTLIMS